ncbi:MAG: hypothetical protein OK456_03155 [Thaumarchaeota archaeon]|nr:hypothetical protein [Nitrososphaerota archaeon]
MDLGLKLVREGDTDLYVPEKSLAGGAPDTYPVFYNPAAKTNRDISVCVASVTRPATFLDALAGTGARGVRVGNEGNRGRGKGAAPQVTLVDFNRMSLQVARRNVKLNGLGRRCTVTHSETNRFLCSRFDRGEKFEAVDVDPFGSPAPYIQAALTACAPGAILSFTATDAAVLCGVYPLVSLRRYGASSIRNEFVHETGLRTLMGFAARAGGVNDIGVEPVLAHSTLHYLRVYLRVRRGATEADRAMEGLGYVTQCNTCLERWASKLPSERCDSCGRKVRSSGPLWTGKVAESGLVSQSAKFGSERGWKEAESIIASLGRVDDFPPFSYSLERACSLKKVSSTSVEKVIGELQSNGFSAMRQPFELDGIKTDATHEEFVQAVVAASRLLR